MYADYCGIFAEFFLQHGQVDATGDLDAVALWWPVGRLLEMDIPDYAERLAHVTGNAVGRFVTLDMTARAHDPTYRPHHYLASLAVRPDRQGQGMGSALLRHRHTQLDTDATPAYLEATGPRSRTLLQRHGYTAWGPIRIPDGPALHPMWRPRTYSHLR
ncbi:GNAT family N-acetyltransferase [Dactylosporangium sp. NPDC048998]|uniref:GNAT family N-acetyltransferase n=1 Tax=Dactylosporangium sp. NPDC048998 TaxID=3363976 RepID=UPI003716DD1A